MNPETFRALLRERQRALARAARDEVLGVRSAGLETLEEFESELFAPERIAEARRDLEQAVPSRARAHARARLGIVTEWGISSRLRGLEARLRSARTAGRIEEAREVGAEWRGRFVAETAGVGGIDLLSLAGHVREVDLAGVPAEMRALLDGSSSLAHGILGGARGTRLLRDEAGSLATEGPVHGSSTPGASPIPPGSFAGRLGFLLAGLARDAADRDAAAADSGLRELARDLRLGTAKGLEIWSGKNGDGGSAGRQDGIARALRESPAILEEDPPDTVHLILPDGRALGAFAATLEAGGRSLVAATRAANLPLELRLFVDPAIPWAVGTLFASLAGEPGGHARGGEARRGHALARELVAVRASAARFLEHRALIDGREPDREPWVEASLDRAAHRFASLPDEGDQVLDPADRFRGALFAASLLDRLRTRFGNLWYREKRAGTMIRDACEPGGTTTMSELVTGLGLAPPSVDQLIDHWHHWRRLAERSL